jgi:hypothetical protein
VPIPELRPHEAAHIPLPSSAASLASSSHSDASPGLTFATRPEPMAAPTPLFGGGTTFYTPAGTAAPVSAVSGAPQTLFATPQGPEAVASDFQRLADGATHEVQAAQLPAAAAAEVSPLTGLPLGAALLAAAHEGGPRVPGSSRAPGVAADELAESDCGDAGSELQLVRAALDEATAGSADAGGSKLPKPPPKRMTAPAAGALCLLLC